MANKGKRGRERVEAIAYLRTSSATNVGPDKDSEKRQLAAIHAYAQRAGYIIVDQFYDAAVSGADPVKDRPGFAAMLKRIAGNGVRTIIVETANRFARDLVVQETGFRFLREKGIDLIAADSPEAFLDDTPTARFIRQVLGAMGELDKAMTVAKLKGARDRKSAEAGRRIEGRKGFAETHPKAVALAKRLRRASPKTGERRSLREISKLLAEANCLNHKGQPFNQRSIKAMIDGPMPAGGASDDD